MARKCDWCDAPIDCDRCPQGVYHMHRDCHTKAVQQGYFAKLSAAKQQFPIPCGYNAYHYAIGYSIVEVT